MDRVTRKPLLTPSNPLIDAESRGRGEQGTPNTMLLRRPCNGQGGAVKYGTTRGFSRISSPCAKPSASERGHKGGSKMAA